MDERFESLREKTNEKNGLNRSNELKNYHFYNWKNKFIEKKNRFLLNRRFFRTNFKKRQCFTRRTIFRTNFWKNFIFFYWKNGFTKLTILLDEDFTERSFSEKTNEIDWKLKIILRTNENNFFNDWKMNERNGLKRTMNERNGKKPNAPISREFYISDPFFELLSKINTPLANFRKLYL